ncbi:MAG: 6-pyruvoyl-tetrahydropterin synthase-related protein [Rhodocyclaceae bacterium]
MLRRLALSALSLIVLVAMAVLILYPRIVLQLISRGDLAFFALSIEDYARALADGVWWPRWSASPAQGLGSPTFVYYPPLYFLAAALARAGLGDTWLAIRLLDLLACVGVGLVGWAFARSIRLGYRASVLIAVVCMVSPFQIRSLLEISGLPWNFAYPFGLALFCALLYPGFNVTRLVIIWLATLLLSATHLLMAFMCLLCLPVGLLAQAGPRSAWREIIIKGLACCAGFAAAAFAWLPAMSLNGLRNVAGYMQDVDWHAGFAMPFWDTQLYGIRWAYFQWGVAALLLLNTVLLMYALWQLRGVLSETQRRFGRSMLVCAMVALLFSSQMTLPLWLASETLRSVQYAYRFFSVASLALALLTGYLLALSIAARGWTRPVVALSAAVVANVLLLVATVFNFAHTTSSTYRETIPADVDRRAALRAFLPAAAGSLGWQSYLEQGGLVGECARQGLDCATELQSTHRFVWRIRAPQAGVVTLPLLAYPAWSVSINGKPVERRDGRENRTRVGACRGGRQSRRSALDASAAGADRPVRQPCRRVTTVGCMDAVGGKTAGCA